MIATGLQRNTRQTLRASTALALVLILAAGHSARADGSLPQGGSIVAGAGAITSGDGVMTITQTTPRLITDWDSFSVGASSVVRFAQPGASAVALNRVTGGAASEIHGRVEANGQVFLLNPQGVLFGPRSQVQTGAFVASALDLRNEDFLAGRYQFSGGRVGAAIVNEGLIEGNVVALVAPVVRNHGVLRGDVALAGGGNVLLDFDGDGLISVEIGASDIDGLVENTGRIEGNNLVVLSARGASAARAGVVNNTGTIEARGMVARGGRILLTGDMDRGAVRAGGTLRTNPAGFVETSAAQVEILPGLEVQTDGGRWLIDPTDIVIDATAASAIAQSLLTGSVEVETQSAGTGRGDIFVNSPIAWEGQDDQLHTLTLTAHASVIVNAPLSVGRNAALVVDYNSRLWDSTVRNADRGLFQVNEPVNLHPEAAFRTIDGPVIFGTARREHNYIIINELADLAGISAAPDLAYALGNSLTLGARDPLANTFSGVFDGLGHTLADPVIRMPGEDRVGLFRTLTGDVRNLAVTGAQIEGGSSVGTIAGTMSSGVIENVRVQGSVTGFAEVTISGETFPSADEAGGIVGGGGGVIQNASAQVDVAGHFRVGGIAGGSSFNIDRVEVRGSVTGHQRLGGVVGVGQSVQNAFADVAILGLPYASPANRNQNATLVGGITAGVATIENTLAVGSITIEPHPLAELSFVELETYGPVAPQNLPEIFIPQTGQLVFAPDTNFYLDGALPNRVHDSWVGIALAPFEARATETYTAAGWDFGRIWGRRDDINDGFPALRALYPGINLSDITRILVTVPTLIRAYGDANPLLAGLWTASGCDACIAGVDWTPLITPETDVGTYFHNNGAVSATLAAGLDPMDYEISFAQNFLQIDPRLITVSGALAAQKTYDNRREGLVADAGLLEGVLFGDDVRHVLDLDAALHVSADAAPDNPLEVPVTLAGSAAANYRLDGPILSLPGAIDQRDVSVVGVLVARREYDGTTHVTLLDFGMLDNVVPEDEAGLEFTHLAAMFDDKHAGADKPVTLETVLSGARAPNYRLVTPEILDPGDALTGTIDPRPIGVTGSFVTDTRVYDGTLDARVETHSLVADPARLIAGDDLFVNARGAPAQFLDRNAGENKEAVLADLPERIMELTGASAGDYVLQTAAEGALPRGTGTITPRPLEIRDVRIADKDYDATTLATITNSGFLVNRIAGDDIGHDLRTPDALLNFLPSFQDKTVGIGKPVTLRVLLTGEDAGNYFAPPDFIETATIRPRLVTLDLMRFEVRPKTYDATDAADVALFEARFQPGAILAEDEVVIDPDAVSARFQSRHAGTHNAVAGSFPLAGADGGNYAILGGFLTTAQAEISPAPLVLGGFDFIDRLADGSTRVGTTGLGTLSGVQGGDAITVLNLSAFASDPGPGVVPVDLINADLGGTNPEDYEIAGFEPLRSSVHFFDPSDVQTVRPQPDRPDRPRVPPGVPLIDGPLIQTALPGLFDFGPPPPPPTPPGQAGVATQDSATGPEMRERLAGALAVLREAQIDLQGIILGDALLAGHSTQTAQTVVQLEEAVSTWIRFIEALIGDADGNLDPGQTLREVDWILGSAPELLAAIGNSNRALLPDLGPVFDALTDLRDTLASGSDQTPLTVLPADAAPAPTPTPAVVTTGQADAPGAPIDEEDPIELGDGEFIVGGTNDRGLFVPPPSAPRAPASTPGTDAQDSAAALADEAPTDTVSADWVEDVAIGSGAADIIVMEPLTEIPNIEITRTPGSPASGVALPNGTDSDLASPPGDAVALSGGTPRGPSVITDPDSPSLPSDDPQEVEHSEFRTGPPPAISTEAPPLRAAPFDQQMSALVALQIEMLVLTRDAIEDEIHRLQDQNSRLNNMLVSGESPSRDADLRVLLNREEQITVLEDMRHLISALVERPNLAPLLPLDVGAFLNDLQRSFWRADIESFVEIDPRPALPPAPGPQIFVDHSLPATEVPTDPAELLASNGIDPRQLAKFLESLYAQRRQFRAELEELRQREELQREQLEEAERSRAPLGEIEEIEQRLLVTRRRIETDKALLLDFDALLEGRANLASVDPSIPRDLYNSIGAPEERFVRSVGPQGMTWLVGRMDLVALVQGVLAPRSTEPTDPANLLEQHNANPALVERFVSDLGELRAKLRAALPVLVAEERLREQFPERYTVPGAPIGLDLPPAEVVERMLAELDRFFVDGVALGALDQGLFDTMLAIIRDSFGRAPLRGSPPLSWVAVSDVLRRYDPQSLFHAPGLAAATSGADRGESAPTIFQPSPLTMEFVANTEMFAVQQAAFTSENIFRRAVLLLNTVLETQGALTRETYADLRSAFPSEMQEHIDALFEDSDGPLTRETLTTMPDEGSMADPERAKVVLGLINRTLSTEMARYFATLGMAYEHGEKVGIAD